MINTQQSSFVSGQLSVISYQSSAVWEIARSPFQTSNIAYWLLILQFGSGTSFWARGFNFHLSDLWTSSLVGFNVSIIVTLKLSWLIVIWSAFSVQAICNADINNSFYQSSLLLFVCLLVLTGICPFIKYIIIK